MSECLMTLHRQCHHLTVVLNSETVTLSNLAVPSSQIDLKNLKIQLESLENLLPHICLYDVESPATENSE